MSLPGRCFEELKNLLVDEGEMGGQQGQIKVLVEVSTKTLISTKTWISTKTCITHYPTYYFYCHPRQTTELEVLVQYQVLVEIQVSVKVSTKTWISTKTWY